jgi:cytochrome c biogenesis factor
MAEPTTRDGEMSSIEAEKIAAGISRRMKKTESGGYHVKWWQVDAVIVTALIALIFTGVPVLGKLTFASEIRPERDKAINDAIKPVEKRLDGIEAKVGGLDSKVDDVSALLKEQVVASLASNICRYAVRRSKETDFDERARLMQQINDMKDKFKKYTLTDFDIHDC